MIKLLNVSKTYKSQDLSFLALKNLNLSVKSGEFVAIIGASGSGKTTLMNMLGLIDRPDCGEYFFDNTDVLSLTSKQMSDFRRQKVGFVFQSFNLLSKLSAVENVELPLMFKGISRQKRRELALKSLDTVSLSDKAFNKPCELSGGQQQRVAIARAIITDAPLLLADEPTGNLDSVSGSEILNLLINRHKNGKTVILITHDRKVAKMAERVIEIKDGEILN